ncbi:MAG: hypothetical protein J5803_01840, partial [Desulfovibrio sp.]|nr:hypothetical protein [Desulfovibrio sp.]
MQERANTLLRLCDRYLGIPLATFTALFRIFEGKEQKKEPKRVAFLCLGAIGDLLLFTTLITALRKKLPNAHFLLVSSCANAGTLPLIPSLDEYRSFSVKAFPKMIAYLRSQTIDILFDSSQWTRLGAIVSNCSGAAITVGFATQGQWRSAGYTYAVSHSSTVHECENFL